MGKVIQAGPLPAPDPVKDVEDLLDIWDVMKIFDVCEETARNFYRKHGLRVIHLPGGREVRFTREDVRDFIEQLRQRSA